MSKPMLVALCVAALTVAAADQTLSQPPVGEDGQPVDAGRGAGPTSQADADDLRRRFVELATERAQALEADALRAEVARMEREKREGEMRRSLEPAVTELRRVLESEEFAASEAGRRARFALRVLQYEVEPVQSARASTPQRRGGSSRPDPETAAERVFGFLDRDRDGRLVPEEWSTVNPTLRQQFEDGGIDLSQPVSQKEFVGEYVRLRPEGR